MFDVLIIGRGLFGAAAARHLSALTNNIAVIGPAEPTDLASHTGAFGSHYDQGRITRKLGGDWVWSLLAQQAIAEYAGLAEASGIQFHEPVGGLFVAPPTDSYLNDVAAIAGRSGASYAEVTPAEVTKRYPHLRFPTTHRIIHEGAPAGYINPRDLIRAELAVAAAQGAVQIDDTVVSIDTGAASGSLDVKTLTGRRIRARQVLLTTGAFTNAYELLPRPLDLRLKTEHVLLVPVTAELAASMTGMPTVIYQIEADNVNDIYLLPPIKYPDGQFYVKMGANTRFDRFLTGRNELRRWYIDGDSDVAAKDLRAALGAILPELPLTSGHTSRCLVTYTRHRRPYIGAVIPERLFVAVGGNGRGAKSADAIGRLAADTVRGQPLPAAFDPALFKIHFAAS